MMNTAKMLMICSVSAMANGEFFLTLPRQPPIWTLSDAIAPNVSRKKMSVVDPEDRRAQLVAELEARQFGGT